MSDGSVGFSFRAEFEGELTVDEVPEDFFARMARRVAEGLFVPGRRDRANYRVCSSSRDSLEFTADDFLTAYNVGLNDVELRRAGPGAIAYRVGFGRWSRYAKLHGVLIGGAVAAVAYLIPSVRRDVHSYPHGDLLFWGMLMFWSLAWPWLLTALHRPFARKGLERILRDELARGGTSREAA